MWGNSCCDFEEGREDMGIDRTNLHIISHEDQSSSSVVMSF